MAPFMLLSNGYLRSLGCWLTLRSPRISLPRRPATQSKRSYKAKYTHGYGSSSWRIAAGTRHRRREPQRLWRRQPLWPVDCDNTLPTVWDRLVWGSQPPWELRCDCVSSSCQSAQADALRSQRRLGPPLELHQAWALCSGERGKFGVPISRELSSCQRLCRGDVWPSTHRKGVSTWNLDQKRLG